MTMVHVLVMAKAPVPGQVKTRLGRDVGMEPAAALAAAALMDTLETCGRLFGPDRCHLALSGTLAAAVGGAEISAMLDGWWVRPQRGERLGERLARAHEDLADLPGLPGVVQVGMDTPQASAADLRAVVAGLENCDAVLAPASDGGWWALGLRSPAEAGPLAGVRMSTARAGTDTRAALEAAGLRVGAGPVVRDVDTVADARAVAASAPGTRFARAWAALAFREAP